MKKSIILMLALASLLLLLSAGTALAGETQVHPLMAGQHTQVGTVTISDDGSQLTATFAITEDGWYLTTTHLYVGDEAPKKSAPGQFPYKHEGIHATTDTFVVPIVPVTTYYVAAHADVLNENNIIACECSTFPETGSITWGAIPGVSSFMDIGVSSSTLNGVLPGWCIDASHYLEYSAAYFVSTLLDPLPDELIIGPDPHVDHPENLDLVNWVINHREGYDSLKVQNVIWYLLDDQKPGLGYDEGVLYYAALTNGQGFVPDCSAGDICTFIAAPVIETEGQVLLLEVGCEPTYQSETAWAQGDIFWRTGWGSYFTYATAHPLEGEWLLSVNDGSYEHDMFITDVSSSGAITGYGGYPTGEGPSYPYPYNWTLVGQITGSTVTMTLSYQNSYTATITGSIASDWNSMSGGAGTGGVDNWSATRP